MANWWEEIVVPDNWDWRKKKDVKEKIQQHHAVDPQDQFAPVRHMRIDDAPTWEQFVAFSGIVSKDENWANASREIQSEAIKNNFGFTDMKEVLKSDDAPTWDEATRDRVISAYVNMVPEFRRIQGTPEGDEALRSLTDSFENLHWEKKQEIEAEGRIRAQEEEEAAEEAAVEREAEWERRLPMHMRGVRRGFAPDIEVPQLEQATAMAPPMAPPQDPERDTGRRYQYQDVVDSFVADPQFEGEPEKAQFYADAWMNLGGNAQFRYKASNAERQEKISEVLESDYGQQMSLAERVGFRQRMTQDLPSTYRDGWEPEAPEGFLENLVADSNMGWKQLQLGYESSIVNAMYMAEYAGAKEDGVDTAPFEKRLMGNLEDIARITDEIRKSPQSTFARLGKEVYNGTASKEEYTAWLASTTYQSLVSFSPGLAASIPAGALGGPAAVGATQATMSHVLEYGPSLLDFLEGEGVNVNDADELFKTFTTDDVMMQKAREYALKRDIPIVALDGLAGVFSARMGAAKRSAENAAKAAGTTLKSNWWREIGALANEATLGGVGEATAQWFTTGEMDDKHAIIAEMVGELPTGVTSMIGGYVSEAGAEQRQRGDFGDIDLGGIGEELATPPVEVEADAAPAPTEFVAPEDARDLVAPSGLEEPQQQYYDALSDDDKAAVKAEADDLFDERMGVAMEGYGYAPEEVSRFPDQEMAQIGREAFSDTLDKHKDETAAQEEAEIEPEAPERPVEAAEPAPGTPAPAEPVAAEPAPAPRVLTLKEMKAMLREVTSPEEIDVLEREWEERGNPRSTNGPKAFAAARKRIGIEQVATDEEIGVQETIGTAAVSEQPELAKVRWTTPDGKVIEGTVHHDEESDQVAIKRGDEYHYLDADEQVQIFADYGKPEVEAKPKPKAEKFGGSDLTIEEWAESYEAELGERPTDKQLYEYVTGKTTQARGVGREPVPMVDEPLDVTLRQVKDARKAVEPEVTEEAIVEPEPEPVEAAEPEPVVEAVPTVAGVEIPRQPNGAPSIKAMKDAAAAATTIEEIDELQRMENNAVEDGFIKAHRKSVQNKINKRKDDLLKPAPEVEAKPTPAPVETKPEAEAKPKKKRKTLTDKVEEAEEKAKPKPKKAKKKAKAPVDPAKE
ncbi:MAG: hypothetical protein ACYSWO_25230, partial [Planctomycetota bacterium]